jgi:hypothetical protein
MAGGWRYRWSDAGGAFETAAAAVSVTAPDRGAVAAPAGDASDGVQTLTHNAQHSSGVQRLAGGTRWLGCWPAIGAMPVMSPAMA